MSRRVLLIYAHPFPRKSRVNQRLRRAVDGLANVEARDLYEIYPDFHIQMKKEQERMLESDVILLQHPFYWYSYPSLLKEWIDVVLEKGWAYGEGGEALRGKYWGHAITTAGQVPAYDRTGYNHFSIPELLRPSEQTAYLCGMIPMAPFLTQGVGKLTDADIEKRAGEYRQFVASLSSDLPIEKYGTV